MSCRVYWGSHGCSRERGHDGLHECDCCEHASISEHLALDGMVADSEGDFLCVATYPYYGPETEFYGEDVPDQVAV